MTDAELKDCPFCDSDDIQSGGDDKVVGYWCNNCQAHGPNEYGNYTWNDRVPSPPAVTVKPLVWGFHPAGEVASDNVGSSYIIDKRRARVSFLKWPQGFSPDVENIEEAKAVAQADYERRILSALTPGQPATEGR